MNAEISSLFESTLHSPSLFSLQAKLGGTEVRDYCIPVNPYFPTPAMFDGFRSRLETVLKYYPGYNEDIATTLSRTFGYDPETLVMGNGSTELITFIDLLFVRSLAIPIPTFSRWTETPFGNGKPVQLFRRREEEGFALDVDGFIDFIRRSDANAAVICNPNNPTGAFCATKEVIRMVEALQHLDVIVIDESFADFVDEFEIPSVAKEAVRYPNVIVLKSLGKSFGLHGVRAGFAIANPALAGKLRKAIPYWNLNAVAEMLVRDLGQYMEVYEQGRRQVVRDRQSLEMGLRSVSGLKVFPSRANFVYFRVPDGVSGPELRNRLLEDHGILVRECGNKSGSSSQFFRVAARPQGENRYLLKALKKELGSKTES